MFINKERSEKHVPKPALHHQTESSKRIVNRQIKQWRTFERR
jgi:hypothetical protein